MERGGIHHKEALKIMLFVSETAFRATEQAVRVLCGVGMMQQYGVGPHSRHAIVYLFGEDTSDVRRNLTSRATKERDLLP